MKINAIPLFTMIIYFNGASQSYCVSSYKIFPSTIVKILFVADNRPVGILNISCDKTARSASMPGINMPFLFL
ncbi:MAG: hypothetical protein ABI172_04205 [Ginsengibacter sp.]